MLSQIDPTVVLRPQANQTSQAASMDAANNVFKVLHGFYGTLFLSKWSSGEVDADGEDRGFVSARQVWAHGLREFDLGTVKAALAVCLEAHPEFPPSLPQFAAICKARQPRRAWTPPVSTQPQLEMSDELRAQRRAEARAAATEAAHKVMAARQPKGLDLLKQSIANAVGTAGGDEAAVLLRLDKQLAAKGAANDAR